MSKKGLYLGTPGNMQWIPAPHVGITRTPNRYTYETEYTNGGSSIYQSVTGTMKYEMDFGLKRPQDMQHLVACDQGAYGELVYFTDPFAATTNILPAYWASPWMGSVGAPVLQGPTGAYPLVTENTPANTYGYPSKMAKFGAFGTQIWGGFPRSVWIPVPDGYTFHFGVHGVAPAPGLYMTIQPDGSSAVNATLLSVTTSTLTNYTHTPTGPGGITLKLGGNSATPLSIAGMVAQVLPTGQPAPTGNFIPGEGNSGCHIVGGIQRLGYSSAMNWEQYSIVLREHWPMGIS